MQFFIKLYSSIFIGSGKSFNKGEILLGGDNFSLNPLPFFSIFKGNIKSILLHTKKGFLFPIPKDIFGFKENCETKVDTYKLRIKGDRKLLITSLEMKQKIKEANGFLPKNKFEGYLKRGNLSKDTYIGYEEILKSKITPNIEIDKTNGIVKEQMLTFKKVNEFNENLRIFIDVNIGNSKSYAIIGGETSLGIVEKINSEEKIFTNENKLKKDIKGKIKENQYFKIILLTPTNYPPDLEKEFNGKVKKIAQMIGKPIAFSGWFNVYSNNEKVDSFPSRLFKLIPAGSVFYYKISDEIAKDSSKLDEFVEGLFTRYWLKPAFFVKEYPYFEEKEEEDPHTKEKIMINPLGFGLSVIGVAQVEE